MTTESIDDSPVSDWKVPTMTMGSQQVLIVIVLGAVAFATYVWQLSVPLYLQLYDSGVAFAGSIHLVSGVLPYRDFVFPQPPGLLLLMSPFAVLSRLVGTHGGFETARVLSAFVTALNVTMLSWLIRHRGRVAMIVAGVGLALTPVAVFFSTGVRLDPYCLCLVLLGSLRILSSPTRNERIATRSLVVGGVLFGLAALVEFWAFFPFLALVLCLTPRCRGRVSVLVASAGAGLVIPSLPFFLAAPRGFWTQVFTDQMSRRSGTGPGVLWRLVRLTGLAGTTNTPTVGEAVAAFVVLSAAVVVAYRRRIGDELVDFFVLTSAVITTCGLLASPTAYTDSGYFAAPFLLGLVGVTLGRLGGPTRRLADLVAISSEVRRLLRWAGAATGVVLVTGLVLYVTTFYSIHERLYGVTGAQIATITTFIPAGSCVLYTEVGEGLLADRFFSTRPHCPTVVDPFGESMAWGFELVAPAPSFVAQWKSYLEHAQYVVTQQPLLGQSASNGAYPAYRSLIPWNRHLTAWFAQHFRPVNYGRYRPPLVSLYIYVRKSRS